MSAQPKIYKPRFHMTTMIRDVLNKASAIKNDKMGENRAIVWSLLKDNQGHLIFQKQMSSCAKGSAGENTHEKSSLVKQHHKLVSLQI